MTQSRRSERKGRDPRCYMFGEHSNSRAAGAVRFARSRRGVTLIELLVAMSLFSMLSVAVLFSLRTGMSTLERTRERVTAARRADGAQRALERMLAGILPVTAEFITRGSPQPATAFFFQGDPQTMRFVTTYSLQEGLRGAPRIVELTVIDKEDRTARRLIANEFPYFGPPSTGAFILGQGTDPGGAPLLLFRPVSIGPGSFVLADNLPACRFLYLDRVPAPELDRWLPFWRNRHLPRAVRLEMGSQRNVTGQIYASPIH